jgi:outer membrane receptor protein involved in Fe transport
VFYSLGGSGLDASPYPLNGPQQKADYLQQRFGATLGGPLKIPGVYDGSTRTSFFFSYMGNHSTSPHDVYSTVPTAAERSGDFSGLGRTIVDPATESPFPGGVIPTSRIDPSAQALLPFIPLPNLPGTTQNFHYVTAAANSSDQFTLRFTHGFGGGQGGESGPGRRETAGPRLRGGGMGRRPTLTVGITYRTTSSDDTTAFPTLGGTTHGTAWDVPVTFSFTKGRVFNQLRFDFNRSRSDGLNLYAYSRDVAGEAGIDGVATDPFDWGVPNLSFTTYASLRDPIPTSRLDQRISFLDTQTATWGRHTVRWGGAYNGLRRESQTDPNARGSFVFTGLYTTGVASGQAIPDTGLDLADFLLGYPQQASVQYGPGRERFHGSSWSLFAQDDWRLGSNLTLNLGLRYEYVSPFTEADNHLVNLDVTPDFTAAVPVLAGQSGAFTGAFPDSLVFGDHNNLAPRVGLAWKPDSHTTIRAGYGTTYNLAAYGPIAQSLAGQPPFAVSDTRIGSRDVPLLLANSFVPVPVPTTTNSFGIDKNYQLGKVQIWNLDVQREVGRIWILGIGYAGTRGADLDLERAPNRGPEGLRIPDVQPFLWQSSDASSVMHSLVVRIRRRMTHGVAFGVSYIFSKSLDDASSIGGGTMVVAQNDEDLAAEWGRSSFDRRHRVAADYVVELPFGPGRHWLERGLGAALLGGWMWNGTASVQSGAPFTARVQGDFADVARGVNGTLRADVTGNPVAVADPTPERWFNTGAFVAPPLGAFGDVGRNTVNGPATVLLNMGLTRNVPLGSTRTLSIRVQASNVFNTPQFTVIDTVVNSPTFGRVIATGPMRTVQIQMRFRL